MKKNTELQVNPAVSHTLFVNVAIRQLALTQNMFNHSITHVVFSH